MTMLFELGMIGGLLAVASNPSPYYAALGLVGSAGVGCLMLMNGGASFLSLVLFLVYLGGMVVVFAYSVALVGDLYPEAWGGVGVVVNLTIYILLLGLWWLVAWGGGEVVVDVGSGLWMVDWLGVSMLFSAGGGLLLAVGWALFLTLFGVLEVVRGHYSGVLRAV